MVGNAHLSHRVSLNIPEVTVCLTFGFGCSGPPVAPVAAGLELVACAQAQAPVSCSLQAIDSIHQVGVYCLALVPANTLPKAPLGGIHVSETKQRFLEGMLHPCNVLMCPHTCVTNLPKPRQKQPG